VAGQPSARAKTKINNQEEEPKDKEEQQEGTKNQDQQKSKKQGRTKINKTKIEYGTHLHQPGGRCRWTRI
jgi:hypothetical protein